MPDFRIYWTKPTGSLRSGNDIMKKMLVFAVASVLLLSGCSNKEKDFDNGWRIISYYDSAEYDKNGMFLPKTDENEYLEFLDFTTMETAPVCDDPSCTHKDPEACTAYGKNNHPFIYDGKLYYFTETDIYQKNNEYSRNTKLWQSDINGANEKEIYEFEDCTIQYYDRLLLCEGTIYICAVDQPYDQNYDELEPSVVLFSFDLKKHKMSEPVKIVEGYGCSSWLYGAWDGEVIIRTSKSVDNRPYMEKLEEYAKDNALTDKQAMAEFEDMYTSKIISYEPDKEKISVCELPEPLAVTEKFYFYNDGDSLKYIDDNGENVIEQIKNADAVTDHGDYCIISSENSTYIFSYETQEINEITLDEGLSVAAIYQENVILYRADSVSYEKKSISELEQPK